MIACVSVGQEILNSDPNMIGRGRLLLGLDAKASGCDCGFKALVSPKTGLW